MNFFTSLRGKKLVPSWEYTADGLIWRLVPTSSGGLFGEVRDPDRKTASFFCLDRRTGDVRWKDLSLEPGWWVGISGLNGSTAFLHGFASPDLPGERGIFAVDLQSGIVRWKDDHLTFLHAAGDAVYASRESMDGRNLYEIDGATGTIVREIDDMVLANVIESARESDNQTDVQFPIVYKAGHDADATVRGLADAAPPRSDRRIYVESLIHENIAVIAYYDDTSTDPRKPLLKQSIAVIELMKKTLLFTDRITAEAASVVPVAFFMMEDCIYYVKERRSLVALDISTMRRTDG